MISYAQNHEDVVLARTFADQPQGFYVDIGAEHPEHNSVTKYFYDHGWRGINVEPSRSMLAELERERPQDTNLGVGISDVEGKLTFYEGPPENHGSSTFRPDIAAQYQRSGEPFTVVDDVAITTLEIVCEEHVGNRQIDFLKIDVEGFESKVVDGANWEKWRPRVIVIESTQPQIGIARDDWELTLREAGYIEALFDGINTFYALADEHVLLARLSSPASVLDNYNDAVHLDEIAALQGTVDRLGRELDDARSAVTGLESVAAQCEALENRVRDVLRDLHRTQDRLEASVEDVKEADVAAVALRASAAGHHSVRLSAERQRDEALTRAEEAEAELERFKATRTLRWTHGMRRMLGSLRGRKVY